MGPVNGLSIKYEDYGPTCSNIEENLAYWSMSPHNLAPKIYVNCGPIYSECWPKYSWAHMIRYLTCQLTQFEYANMSPQ